MNIDYCLVGSKIKAKRREIGMTQEKLAEALSVSVGYISQVERGVTKISLDLLAHISGVLKCDIAQFVSETAVGESGYLKGDFVEKYNRLSSRQKRMVLRFIDVVLEESEE